MLLFYCSPVQMVLDVCTRTFQVKSRDYPNEWVRMYLSGRPAKRWNGRLMGA